MNLIPRKGFTPMAAFTLIELLVVIAIIATLAGILFPVFAQARERARQAACLSNMKQLGTAALLYIQDYDGTFPAFIEAPPIHGGTELNMPYDRQLIPYIKNDDIFRCPGDGLRRATVSVWDGDYARHPKPRSYGLVADLYTENGARQGKETDINTGVVGETVASLEAPAETAFLVESWAANTGWQSGDSTLGGISGSLFTGCDAWKLPGRRAGTDRLTNCDVSDAPARGHHDRGNYVYADGHVQSLSWQQARANDFRLFWRKK
jgi:prepilin-type N-terminal cleavage/methylation domain-containing protein/prepilin-type processing-associated H-X9-DG protein